MGRNDAVQTLRQHLEQAQAGTGQVLLISGEAGIGKSRLVREARIIATERGIVTLQGNCFEQDRALPFAPFVDLLRGQDLTGLQDLSGLRNVAAQLIKFAPELSMRFTDVQPAPIAEPEQEKRDLFRAWINLFTEPARGFKTPRGLMIIIEDLHWCDDMSLELVLLLARATASQSIALLLTYRNDEPPPVSAPVRPGRDGWGLTRLLAQLDRERLAHELALKPLSPTHIEAMMRAIFKQETPISHEFADAIGLLTEGNPFFVEEVLRTLVSSGDIYKANGRWTRKTTRELRVPRTVQVAVAQRVQSLSEAAKRILDIAAVAGQRFDVALLQALTGLPEPELLACLRELMAVQLIIEGTADEFLFRHALTREAAYAALLKRERRALHLAVGRALEAKKRDIATERDSDTSAPLSASLSHHFYEAQNWDKALTYARRAGQQAQAVFAPREVIAHFTRAIEAEAHAPLPAEEGVRAGLHRARGHAFEQVGEFDNALADYEAALVAARSTHDQQSEWQMLLDLGFLWAARDYIQAGALFQRALEITPQLHDSRSTAHTLNRVGNWHMNVERPFEAIQYHNEALRLFETLDDKHGLASTFDLLGISHYVAGEYHRSRDFYARAVALLRELGDKSGLLTALAIGSSRGIAWLGRTVLPTQSLLIDRVQDCAQALHIALEMGVRPIEALAHSWLGLNHAMSGDYATALEHAKRGLDVAQAIEHKHFITTARMVLGILHWDVAAWEIARAHLQPALALARETNSIVWMHIITAFLTSTQIQLDAPADAEATLRGAWSNDTPMNGVGFRQMWGASVELLLAQGEPKRALELIEKLIATAPNFGAYRSDKIPYLVQLRGEALLAMGQARAAAKALELGIVGARECDLPALEWRLRAGQGRALLSDGKRDDAATAFGSAKKLAEQLAGRLGDDTLRAGLLKAATVSMLRVSLDSPRRKAKAQYEGLTAREREVAGHIAQGKSNRVIAEAIVLSERTIETHVTNILSKLSFTSRAQLAVWASEKGLR